MVVDAPNVGWLGVPKAPNDMAASFCERCALCYPGAAIACAGALNKAERGAGAASVFSGLALQRTLASRLPGVLWCAGAPRNASEATALRRLSKTAVSETKLAACNTLARVLWTGLRRP